MTTRTNTETHYGVARGEKLLTGTPSLAYAKEQLPLYEEQLTALGIDPDVRVVEYDVETTVKTSRLRAYKEPEPAPAPDGDTSAGAAN